MAYHALRCGKVVNYMRGHSDGQDAALKDDSGQHDVAYVGTNGAFNKIAKLDHTAPAEVSIQGEKFVRTSGDHHVGPALAAV